MKIKEVSNQHKWNAFLEKLNPNTFLQSWEWGQLQKHTGENVHYLGFFNKEKQIGAALIITVNAKRGRFLLCPHGPIFKDIKNAHTLLPEFIDFCKTLAEKDKAVGIRIAPLFISNKDNKKLFNRLGFRPAPLHVHAERTWNLDLTDSEENILSQMRKTTRHAIKKAQQANVIVSISNNPESLNSFYSLYQSTRQRHGFIPFTKKFLEKQFQIFNENNHLYVATAKYNNKNVAAAILIQFGKTVFYHHGASIPLPSKISASQLLQWKAILEAKRRGANHYNFWGISPKTTSGDSHPFAGITIFKQGFGGYDLDYMHAQDLPTSPLYWKLWAIDKYRKYKRGF
jgi:lipid II:glycine glycyltransferase (peptidoglycan interpeptide bridge formation enzyme)